MNVRANVGVSGSSRPCRTCRRGGGAGGDALACGVQEGGLERVLLDGQGRGGVVDEGEDVHDAGAGIEGRGAGGGGAAGRRGTGRDGAGDLDGDADGGVVGVADAVAVHVGVLVVGDAVAVDVVRGVEGRVLVREGVLLALVA